MISVTKHYCEICNEELIKIADIEDSEIKIHMRCNPPKEYSKSINIEIDVCPECRKSFSKDIDKIKDILVKWMK